MINDDFWKTIEQAYRQGYIDCLKLVAIHVQEIQTTHLEASVAANMKYVKSKYAEFHGEKVDN